MKTYQTKQVAELIGIHVNTVRFYEKMGLVSKAQRNTNGYRLFTEKQIEEFKLARTAFKSELLQNGLRKKVTTIVKLTATEQYDQAEQLTLDYLRQLEIDQNAAEEALAITKKILAKSSKTLNTEITYKRSEAAQLLNVSIDTLRNWELNGLFEIKRKENGYRVYTESDINYLKIIYSLRHANYSLSSILRMLTKLSSNPETDISEAINLSEETDDIITACDNLLISLEEAKQNALFILTQLDKLRQLNPTVLHHSCS